MTVVLPDDCMFNAGEPAACEWYFHRAGSSGRPFHLLPQRGDAGALDRRPLRRFGWWWVSFSVDPKRGQWISIEPTAGGWGGRHDSDGESALINLVNGGFRNIPAEVMETKFPLRLEEFSIRTRQCRAGQASRRLRRGCGDTRCWRIAMARSGSNARRRPAWGLNGGGDGKGPEVTVSFPDGGRGRSAQDARARLAGRNPLSKPRPAEAVGNGHPLERDVAAVARDVARGLVSREAAARDYGVTVASDGRSEARLMTEPLLLGPGYRSALWRCRRAFRGGYRYPARRGPRADWRETARENPPWGRSWAAFTAPTHGSITRRGSAAGSLGHAHGTGQQGVAIMHQELQLVPRADRGAKTCSSGLRKTAAACCAAPKPRVSWR